MRQPRWQSVDENIFASLRVFWARLGTVLPVDENYTQGD